LVNNVEKPTTPLPPLPLLSSIAIKPLGRYIFIGFIAPSRHPFFRPFLSSPFFYIPLQQKLQHTSFSPLSSFSCTSFFFFSLRQILLYLLKLLLSMLARFLFFPSHEHCFFFFFLLADVPSLWEDAVGEFLVRRPNRSFFAFAFPRRCYSRFLFSVSRSRFFHEFKILLVLVASSSFSCLLIACTFLFFSLARNFAFGDRLCASAAWFGGAGRFSFC
jgi:hypothetical protein